MNYSDNTIDIIANSILRKLLLKYPAMLNYQEPVYSGIKFTLLFLFEAEAMNSKDIFLDNVRWFLLSSDGKNFPLYLFEEIFELIKNELCEFAPETRYRRFCTYMEESIRQTTEWLDSRAYDEKTISRNVAHTKLLTELIQFEPRAEEAFISTLDLEHLNIQRIFEEMLMPIQYEIGRLWYNGVISVAQEHYCTASIDSIIKKLMASYELPNVQKRTFMGLCVQGEEHTIGLNMVCHYFRSAGWSVINLTSNCPVNGVLDILKKQPIDCVGISIAMPFNISKAYSYINTMRDAIENSLKIIVGGIALNRYPEMWKNMGADGYAANISDALKLAES